MGLFPEAEAYTGVADDDDGLIDDWPIDDRLTDDWPIDDWLIEG